MTTYAFCLVTGLFTLASVARAQDAASPPAPAAAAPPAATCPTDEPYCQLSQLIIVPGASGTGMRTLRRANPGIVINGLRPIDRDTLRLPNASVGMRPAAPAM